MYSVTLNNNINFNGHCGCHYIKYGKKKILVTTETAFGRDYETLDRAVKLVNKAFPEIEKKKFIVGACSTAEEVWTLKMLMGEKPVEILGFDISPNVLKVAQSGTYEIFPPNSKKIAPLKDSDGYQDIFLAYDKPNKNVKEQKLYNMFHEMFEEVHKKSYNPFRAERKTYKLKEPQPDCKFINADIKQLPAEITQAEKGQLFSFRNSFYHILTYHNGCCDEARASKEVKPVLDQIMKNINRILYRKGVFLLGKNENEQCPNIKLVTRALVNNGFKPLIHNEKFCNIWEKAKDI